MIHANRATAENAALAAHMEKRAPAWMAELDAREAMIDLDAIFPNSKEVCSTFRGEIIPRVSWIRAKTIVRRFVAR